MVAYNKNMYCKLQTEMAIEMYDCRLKRVVNRWMLFPMDVLFSSFFFSGKADLSASLGYIHTKNISMMHVISN